mgnify:CR=1 FL=1
MKDFYLDLPLCFEKRPISIQRTAEKLFVSKTAMLQTKKEIQDACRWYHGLTIEVSSKGQELRVRKKILRHDPGGDHELLYVWCDIDGTCDHVPVWK